jgi:hypothetical protein
MIKGRTVKEKDGSLQKVWVTCDRSGKPRVFITSIRVVFDTSVSISINRYTVSIRSINIDILTILLAFPAYRLNSFPAYRLDPFLA